MEVTRSNFKEALPVISKAIEDSSFIAIDAEFSGLTARKRENDYFDTCEERYQKLINDVKDFTIVQFGICTFNWDDEQQQYVAKPFNFYIFPKPYNSEMPDMRFLSQSSSLDFLAGHGFDFNKWITQGIPFILPPDEDRLRQMVTREEVEIELAVGFTKVIRLLSQSRKVILGHNMLLDLLHMIRLFISPLPNNLDDFKALVKGVVPSLIDTKVMASVEPLQGHFPRSHLEGVCKKSSEAPFVKPNVLFAEGFLDYSNNSKAHEAGFDAYMIGVAFIAMASYLEKQRDGSISRREMDLEIIKPYLNKIFLFPKLKDFLYLNLDSDDGDDGDDSDDGDDGDSFQSSTNTPSIDTPSKTPETVSSKQLKHDVSSFEVELEQLPDSPEPAKKKLKAQHSEPDHE